MFGQTVLAAFTESCEIHLGNELVFYVERVYIRNLYILL